jgi:hypothetical protein
MAIQKADGVDAYNNFPSKFIKVYCTAAVNAGDVVELDFSATRSPLQGTDAVGLSVVKCPVGDNRPFACGVATETIATAGYVQVQYAGYNASVTPDAAIALGTFVGSDGATAGRIQAFTGNVSATAGYIGFVVDAYVAGAGTNDGAIIILDKGFFNG